ncbi:MAG: hypothetical protein ACI8PT_004743 [Gammaproteobacteria bacterium]|jgi:hypothetical protein
MHAMVFVWALFTVIVFAAESLFLNQWFKRSAEKDSEAVFTLIQRLHWGQPTITLVTVLGAVSGSHRFSF